MSDTQEKFSTLTVYLHWLVGLTIIALLAMGIYMDKENVRALYPIHKSIGVLVFVAVVARVIWRLKNGWPKPASPRKRVEQLVARISHWTLLISSFLMPASGMLMSGAGGRGIDVFGLTVMARNPDPSAPERALPYNKTLMKIGQEMHEILAIVLIVTVLLHIMGALKHHLIDGDGTLRRMLGAKI